MDALFNDSEVVMFSCVKRYFKKLTSFFICLSWTFRSCDTPLPVRTAPMPPGLKVHLGSGPINIEGWINIDARAYHHVHILSDGFGLSEFTDGAISEIYLCHVLEHFSFEEAEALLKSLKVKLRLGGAIRISVPCFDRLIEVYKLSDSDITKVKFALMGGQDYQYNFHKSLYNLKSLRELLERCGYSNILEWKTLTDFGVDLGDWSNGTFATKQGAVPISLNLKGIN
jgi:predicted SAM-dependent methyltransferase